MMTLSLEGNGDENNGVLSFRRQLMTSWILKDSH